MLDHEYRNKTYKRTERSWTLTIVAALFFLIAVSGMIGVWKYIGHDLYTVLTVLLPTGLFAIVCLLAAINGRAHDARNVFSSILDLFLWWP